MEPEAAVKRNFVLALVSVLKGNAVYFALLMPRLPAGLQHAPDRLDAGLAVDFLICAGIYALLHIVEWGGDKQRRGGE